jgi:uncharacterized protein GlcG (DUF336 family)
MSKQESSVYSTMPATNVDTTENEGGTTLWNHAKTFALVGVSPSSGQCDMQ